MGCNAGRGSDAQPDDCEMTTHPACAAPEQNLLQDLVDGALDPTTSRQVSDHAATCGHCGPELSALRDLEATMGSAHLSSDEVVEAAWGGRSANEPHLLYCSKCRDEVATIRTARMDAGSGEAKRRIRWAVPLALAATVVVALGLVSSRRPGHESGRSTFRGEGLQIRGLVPQGEIPRSATEVVFSWQGAADARYSVSFFSVDGRPLVSLLVTGPRAAVSGDDRAKLEAEASFFWKVEALGTDALASPLERITWRP